MSELHDRYYDCSGLTIEQAAESAKLLIEWHQNVNFWIGDLARYAAARWQENQYQVWPETVSPGLLDRNAGVCAKYPNREDRAIDVSWTHYMRNANEADRLERLRVIFREGLTSDDASKANVDRLMSQQDNRWLLAIDVNYWIAKWYHREGIHAAPQLRDWLWRMIERLKSGFQGLTLTDVVCCFDDKQNDRKQLTMGWEKKYKDRPPKDSEWIDQINLIRKLLEDSGLLCISIEGQEADDVIASYAKQFPGSITIFAVDKDLRQCLGQKVNMLLGLEWEESPTGLTPVYDWLTASKHEKEMGVSCDQWTELQTLAGDSVDGIVGVEGCGITTAAKWLKEFRTVDGVIAAAKAFDPRLTTKQQRKIMDFEPRAEVTRKLVTMRTDLDVPKTTRLGEKR